MASTNADFGSEKSQMRVHFIACLIAGIFLFAVFLHCTASDDDVEEEEEDEDGDDDTVVDDSPCAENDAYESMQWLFDECFEIVGYGDEVVSADSACHLYLDEAVRCFIDCAALYATCNDPGLTGCLEDCGLELMK